MRTFRADEVPAALAHFQDFGYVVFKDAISTATGQAFWSAVEDNIRGNARLQFSAHGQLYTQANLPEELRLALPRIIDIQAHVPIARDLVFSTVTAAFLDALYQEEPTCLQTLTYKYSSEQGPHSDQFLVSPPYVGDYDRSTLAAAWIPFERTGPENGSLIVYPGSHRLSKKRLDLDFENDYGSYMRYLDGLCKESACLPEVYEANVGEILFWNGDLVHAGGAIMGSPRPTRRSFICHYAVVPADRPSLTPDWVRVRAPRGFYYVPSTAPGREPQASELPKKAGFWGRMFAGRTVFSRY